MISNIQLAFSIAIPYSAGGNRIIPSVFPSVLMFSKSFSSLRVCNVGFWLRNQNKTLIYETIFLSDQCRIKSYFKSSRAITIPFNLISSSNVMNVVSVFYPQVLLHLQLLFLSLLFQNKETALFFWEVPFKKKKKAKPDALLHFSVTPVHMSPTSPGREHGPRAACWLWRRTVWWPKSTISCLHILDNFIRKI